MASFIIPAGTGWTMADPADGTLLHKSGTTIGNSMLSAETFVKLSSQQTSTSTSYANLGNLSFAVAASTNYTINFCLVYRTAATTTGIGIAFNGPASPTDIVYMFNIDRGLAAMTIRHSRAYDGPTASPSVDTANTDYTIVGRCLFRNGGNAGTLAMRFASEVSLSQVTVQIGSCLSYRIVA